MNLIRPRLMISAPPNRVFEAMAIQADLSIRGYEVSLDYPVIVGAVLEESAYLQLQAWHESVTRSPDVILCLPMAPGSSKLFIYQERVPGPFERTEIPVLCARERDVALTGATPQRAYSWSHDDMATFYINVKVNRPHAAKKS